MSGVSFGGLLVVMVVACVAPLLVAAISWLRVPAVVLEIITGIAIGPVFGWVDIDMPINVLSVVGLALLLFLTGLELDIGALRGPTLRIAGAGFAATVAIGLTVGVALRMIGWIRDPVFLAVTLTATSLGLLVPVLKDAGESHTTLGGLVLAGSTLGELAAIIALSLLFSQRSGGPGSRVLAVAGLVLAAASVLVVARRKGSGVVRDLLGRLQDTSAQIRVRLAVTLLIGFVALSARVGLESILGAFVAGAVLAAVDRDTMSHPNFRPKLEAIGYGFLIPVFFVSTGLRFDVDALTASPSAFARVPLLLAALVAVRGVPALLYRGLIGWRGAIGAGLLQATSLPFIVTAVTIGTTIGAITAATGAALVAAGLVSVIAFPPLALALIRTARPDPNGTPWRPDVTSRHPRLQGAA